MYGYGAVAKNMHRIANGFGMSTRAYDPFIPKEAIEAAGATFCASVEELFAGANFVSLHIPSTPQTNKSINKALLSSMGKGGVLVNTARSEVVHEQELVELFKERSDLSYVSDVPPSGDMAGEFDALNTDKKKRVFVTKKKMGAQTLEANNN